MSNTIYLSVAALFYTILIGIIFLSKKKLNTIENRIYKILLGVTIFSLITELLIPIYGTSEQLASMRDIVMKIYLLCCLTWVTVFIAYTFFISHKNLAEIKKEDVDVKYRILYIVYILVYIIIAILVIILPIYFYNGVDKYSYGPSVNTVFITCGIYMGIMIIYMLINFKNIRKKGYIPVVVFVIMLMGSTIIQKTNPGILLINFIFGFITCLMYHTIENPDLKLIQELLRNKELVQNSTEDKSKFLFKVSQDIRIPLKDILNYINIYKEEKEISLKNEMVDSIEKRANDISYMVNDVLDISRMDVKNIKVYNTSYDTNKFFEDIKKKTENLLEDKNIKLNMLLSNDIPKVLYGDSIKLKQVLMGIIDNAIKHTKEGFINIDVSSLVRYDVCRMIINVADTGSGMSLESINNVLSQTSDLTKEEEKSLNGLDINLKIIKKILNLIGGSLNIKSEEFKGTTISLYIDQKIEGNEEKDFLAKMDTYNEQMDKRNRILIVNDNLEEVKIFEKALLKYKSIVNVSMFGSDCINKINTNEKYSLILIKDTMKNEEAFEILKKLKKIKGFKTPVVVILDKNKSFMKEHYLKDGFSDYIIKESLNNELKRISDEYL